MLTSIAISPQPGTQQSQYSATADAVWLCGISPPRAWLEPPLLCRPSDRESVSSVCSWGRGEPAVWEERVDVGEDILVGVLRLWGV